VAKPSLGREIGAALLFKALALAVIYFAFFNSHKIAVSSHQMAEFLFDGHSPPR
jgi:hypothetical protein